MNRNKRIIRASILGIVANVFLASFKAVVGFLSGSVAIVMDAVNNLSDVLSSVITIIGTRLAERPADKNHPFGYGRIEYFSAILISVIVLMAGVSSLVESVKKIFHPTDPEYTMFTLIIIVVAILVKILLGRHVRRVGKQVESDALIASGADAMFDAVITLATLVSAGIMLLWHISIDGWLGAFISLAIIKASRCSVRRSTNCWVCAFLPSLSGTSKPKCSSNRAFMVSSMSSSIHTVMAPISVRCT